MGAVSKCGAEQVVGTRPCGCVSDIYLQTTTSSLTICHQRSISVTKCCIPRLHGANAQPQTVKTNSLRRRQMHVGHVAWRTALITCKDRRLPCFKLARLSFSKEIRCVYKDDPSQLTEPQTSRSGHSGSTITSSNALLQRCGKKKRTPIIWQIN